jgi:two-component sensor histidine kinase
VETVSNQFSELKFQRDKREILLREVHHRVNNNLQIISSLVSLYLSKTKEPGHQTLREIQSRIQILSSIHLILLKSLELNEISLTGFLEDLSSSLRYNSDGNYLSLKFTTSGIESPFSFNTLIPMGMLIHELVQLAVCKFWREGELVELGVHISHDPVSGLLQLEMRGENCGSCINTLVQNENVQQTIIQALCEQLEGDLLEASSDDCKWRFTFRDV